jgi:hypothetical protein
MQILQGLQVVAADVDVGAQLAILRRCRRDRIANSCNCARNAGKRADSLAHTGIQSCCS